MVPQRKIYISRLPIELQFQSNLRLPVSRALFIVVDNTNFPISAVHGYRLVAIDDVICYGWPRSPCDGNITGCAGENACGHSVAISKSGTITRIQDATF